MSTIQVDNLVKQYGSSDAAVMAVRGIKFEVQSAELIAIMGESGSGKSTLLSMMGALNTPTSGKYRVDEIDVYALGQEKRADFRRNFLGFIFQSFHLIPYLTVRENVMLPLAPVKMKGKEKRDLAEEALRRVGLAGKTHRLPSQISGGEQERVAIARAIVNRPPILLADEPTGNLDTKTSDEIMHLLQGLNSDGMTIIMVTHSPRNAQFAHRVIQLKDGQIQSLLDADKRRFSGKEDYLTVESSPDKVPRGPENNGSWFLKTDNENCQHCLSATHDPGECCRKQNNLEEEKKNVKHR